MIQDITFTKLQNRFSKAVKLNYSDCGVLLDLSHFSFKHFIQGRLNYCLPGRIKAPVL